MPPKKATCAHWDLTFDCSPNAIEAGFQRPPPGKRLAPPAPPAVRARQAQEADWPASTFPAPLVLPGDELGHDPEAPAQSLLTWYHEPDRNEVTSERCTVYIAEVPTADQSADFLNRWRVPNKGRGAAGSVSSAPSSAHVIPYIQAFYGPLPVKYQDRFSFTAWNKKTRPRGVSPFVALADTEKGTATRISTRLSPEGAFSHQLSSNDIVDALIDAVPADAYALVLLVHHDMFEDDDDDFMIGRAFGADRVAVVSTAHYNPCLDAHHQVEQAHAWPASHCTAMIERRCGNKAPTAEAKHQPSAIHVALQTHPPRPRADPRALWLHRVCRTVSHELGHCFGIDHCVYYACIMQATASLAEDVRQPAYLCPVDWAKVTRATGATRAQWCANMAQMCLEMGPDGGFGALGAWCEAVGADLDGVAF